MRNIKSALSLIALCVAVAALSSLTTYGAMTIVSKPSNTGSILTVAGLSLWTINPTNGLLVNRITMIQWGVNLTAPCNITTNSLFSPDAITIKNTQTKACSVAWQVDPQTPLPGGLNVSISYSGNMITWTNLSPLDYSAISIPSNGFWLEFLNIQLTISSSAVPGSFAFAIDFVSS